MVDLILSRWLDTVYYPVTTGHDNIIYLPLSPYPDWWTNLTLPLTVYSPIGPPTRRMSAAMTLICRSV